MIAFDIDGTLADVNGILQYSDGMLFSYAKEHYPNIKLVYPAMCTLYWLFTYRVSNQIVEYHSNNQNTSLSVGKLRIYFYRKLAVEAGYENR